MKIGKYFNCDGHLVFFYWTIYEEDNFIEDTTRQRQRPLG